MKLRSFNGAQRRLEVGVTGPWPFVYAGSSLGLFRVRRLVKAEA